MKKHKTFRFDLENGEVESLDSDSDEADVIRQLMKTSIMTPIIPCMEYLIPGRLLINLLRQNSKLKTRLEKYEK